MSCIKYGISFFFEGKAFGELEELRCKSGGKKLTAPDGPKGRFLLAVCPNVQGGTDDPQNQTYKR